MTARLFFLLAFFSGAANAADNAEVTLLQVLSYGWQINAVLCVLLFAALFLIAHILLGTRRRRVAPESLSRQLLDDLANNDVDAAQHHAEVSPSALGALALAGLRARRETFDRVTAAMESAGRRALAPVRQEINYLAHIGTLSPMLGLLGTVTGLTKAFNAMGAEATEGLRSAMMTACIGEALGTTVVGLLVGIPAMAAYYLCLSRYSRLGDELEAAAETVAAALPQN